MSDESPDKIRIGGPNDYLAIREDGSAYMVGLNISVVEQAALAYRQMEDEAVLRAVVQYLRDRGWTVDPPKLSDPQGRVGS